MICCSCFQVSGIFRETVWSSVYQPLVPGYNHWVFSIYSSDILNFQNTITNLYRVQSIELVQTIKPTVYYFQRKVSCYNFFRVLKIDNTHFWIPRGFKTIKNYLWLRASWKLIKGYIIKRPGNIKAIMKGNYLAKSMIFFVPSITIMKMHCSLKISQSQGSHCNLAAFVCSEEGYSFFVTSILLAGVVRRLWKFRGVIRIILCSQGKTYKTYLLPLPTSLFVPFSRAL